MMDDFIINAIIGGLLVALAAGPLGCFLVWRRMAYFGDTISHSALMGVALGVALGTSHVLTIIVTSLFISLFLLLLERGGKFSSDTLLGILAHAALSVGLILISLQDSFRQDMMFYLIGDILAITPEDIFTLSLMTLGTLIGVAFIWRSLLTITVHEELARVEGENILLTKVIYMSLIAILVALAIKVVGALLITAMMIIPAAAARTMADSPLKMAVISSLLGALSVFLGIFASSQWDVPAGPAIIISATLLFFIGRIISARE